MATRQVSALAGAVGKKKEPAQLRPFGRLEWLAVGTFMIVGLILIGASMAWYASHYGPSGGSHSTLISKQAITQGEGAAKKLTETTYSDSFLIFTLTAGVLLVLVGGLYGRIRDITLGNMKIDLEDDAPADKGPQNGPAAP